MLQSNDHLDWFHVGKAVKIGLFDKDDKLLARAIGTLHTYSFVGNMHRVWFAEMAEPDLKWLDDAAHSIVVTWDPEASR